MTTTRYVFAALLLLAALAIGAVAFRRQLFNRLAGLSPTTPDQPGDDDREASGADPEYGDELDAMRRSEKELATIAAELELNILDDEQRAWVVDARDLRLSFAELVDHCAQRVNAIIDDFAPGWWEETPAPELPSFGAVRALVTDTQEFAAVTA